MAVTGPSGLESIGFCHLLKFSRLNHPGHSSWYRTLAPELATHLHTPKLLTKESLDSAGGNLLHASSQSEPHGQPNSAPPTTQIERLFYSARQSTGNSLSLQTLTQSSDVKIKLAKDYSKGHAIAPCPRIALHSWVQPLPDAGNYVPVRTISVPRR